MPVGGVDAKQTAAGWIAHASSENKDAVFALDSGGQRRGIAGSPTVGGFPSGLAGLFMESDDAGARRPCVDDQVVTVDKRSGAAAKKEGRFTQAFGEVFLPGDPAGFKLGGLKPGVDPKGEHQAGCRIDDRTAARCVGGAVALSDRDRVVDFPVALASFRMQAFDGFHAIEFMDENEVVAGNDRGGVGAAAPDFPHRCRPGGWKGAEQMGFRRVAVVRGAKKARPVRCCGFGREVFGCLVEAEPVERLGLLGEQAARGKQGKEVSEGFHQARICGSNFFPSSIKCFALPSPKTSPKSSPTVSARSVQSAEHGLAGLVGSPVIPPALLGKLVQVPTGELVPSGLDMLERIVRPLALFAFDCLEEANTEELGSPVLTLMHVCGENEAWQALPGGVDGLLSSAFEVVSDAVESRAFELRHLAKGQQQNVVMALPVMEGNRVRAVICLVGDGKKPLPETSVTLMQSVAQVIYLRDLRERSEQEKGSFLRTTAFVELMGRCAAAEDFESAMQILVNHLRELLGCERVAVALRHWNGTKLATLSGRHEAKGNSEIMGVVEAGISEVVRRDAAMEFDGSKKEHEMLLSAPIEEMRQVLGPRAYLMEPLRDEVGQVCGGWLFTWKDRGDDFAGKRAFLRAINAQVAVQISLWQQGKPQGLRGTAKRLWKKATSNQRRFAALIALAVVVLAVWPVSYRVKAACELQAVVRRTVSAPFDATLLRSLVVPGEHLKQGQVMAELDGREIQFRLADVLADHARAIKKADAALSAGAVAEQQMAQLEAEAKAQEIKVLEYQ